MLALPMKFKVVIAPGTVLHEGNDIATASGVFYAKMQQSQANPLNATTIMLFEDGELATAFMGNDFIQAD